MKKYIGLFILTLMLSVQGAAQQISQNNFYAQNLFSINPAATGIQGSVAGNLNFRDQWSGLKGAPEVTNFGLHGMVSNTMALGLNVEQNTTGVFKQFTSELNYSYRLPFSENQSLAFGLKCGFSQNALNYETMLAANETDPALYSSSPFINETLIRAGTGLHYNRKNLNIHASTPLLYGKQEKQFLQTVFGFASYDFFAAENILKIQPSVLYRHTETSKAQADINLMAEWDKKVWGNLSYRTNKNIIASFGFFLRGIGLGYAYELNRSVLSSAAAGSHEIMLHFEGNFSLAKKDPHYKSSKRGDARI